MSITNRRYRVYVYPTIDYFSNKSLKISDEIEVEPYDSKSTQIVFWLDIASKSRGKAVQDAHDLLNEMYDHYCALKGVYFQTKDTDQFFVFNERKKRQTEFIHTFTPKEFKLTSKEIKILKQNIKKFRNPHYNYLSLAMKYYRRAKYSTNLEDKVIFFFIGLEALYSDNKRGLGYNFANRLAVLLGGNSKTRKSLAKKAKKSYRLRGELVHGSNPTISFKTINEFDLWLRRSILAFIKLSKHYDHQDILIALDEAVLDDKIRLKIRKIAPIKQIK